MWYQRSANSPSGNESCRRWSVKKASARIVWSNGLILRDTSSSTGVRTLTRSDSSAPGAPGAEPLIACCSPSITLAARLTISAQSSGSLAASAAVRRSPTVFDHSPPGNGGTPTASQYCVRAGRIDHDLGERDERLDGDPRGVLDDLAGPHGHGCGSGLAGGASVTSSGTSATM